jgi:hypothetical protein
MGRSAVRRLWPRGACHATPAVHGLEDPGGHRRAYQATDAKTAQRLLLDLARRLEHAAPWRARPPFPRGLAGAPPGGTRGRAGTIERTEPARARQ